jgi:hypothetical protein
MIQYMQSLGSCPQHLYELMTEDNGDTKEAVNARYFAAVERLNAQDWQELGEE